MIAKREIMDYDEALKPVRAYFHGNAGRQRGDPARAVQAMMEVVASERPPLHLLLGEAAWKRMSGKLAQWKDEMDAWESVTLGADFPEGR